MKKHYSFCRNIQKKKRHPKVPSFVVVIRSKSFHFNKKIEQALRFYHDFFLNEHALLHITINLYIFIW
jgi:hypothetical protein